MYINAVLSPPLGTSTVVESTCEAVKFVAALEVSRDNREELLVELWYGCKDGGEWKSAAFAPAPLAAKDLTVYGANTHRGFIQRIYALVLPNNGNLSPFKYTLRFRQGVNSPWIWIRDQTQLEDGQIVFRKPPVPAAFASIFSGSDHNLSAQPVASRPGVDLFEVTAPALASNDVWTAVDVGAPISLEQFYALVKIRTPWMGPRQGSGPFAVDSDALMMGYLRSDGRHVVVLAIAGLQSTTTYICSEQGRVILKSLNDSGSPQVHRALIAIGPDWKATVDAAFDSARALFAGPAIGAAGNAPPEVEPWWKESWFDGLGYCTWNSLGRELTQDRVLASLQDLHDSGIYVSAVIIDDNWQSLDRRRRWERFEANSHFPNGLKGLTSEIRRRFKHVKHIAVWHAIVGYWEGISPEGAIASTYSTTTVKWHGGTEVTLVDETDVYRLYSDFYRFLSDSGIDAVKCDVQSVLADFDRAADRKRLCPAYEQAFKANGLKYFAGRVIYCMALLPQILLPSLLQRNSPTVLLRNSDDFYPDIPDSHPWHVFCNAMNNIYSSNLNCLPDWDMFQTSLPVYGGAHAAGRCVSGGPVYITDSPASHSLELVRLMSAASVREPGRLVTLRPGAASLPLDPYVAYGGSRLLRLATVAGRSSILALFNVSAADSSSELVSLAEFKGLEKEAYVIRQHSTGKVYGPASAAFDKTFVAVTLAVAGWEFLSAVPVQTKGTVGVAVLGLVGQLAGAAAVVGVELKETGPAAAFAVVATVKALGILGLYVSDLEAREVGGMMVQVMGSPVPACTVTKSKTDPRVLEIDVETAWREMGLKAQWSNEVAVELYLGTSEGQ